MNTLMIARIGLAIGPLVMLIGHLGNHDLVWTREPISTFAARAPLDLFVTASMVVSAITVLLLCLAATSHWGERSVLRWMSLIAVGASVLGLILLAVFEETVPPTLPHPSPTAHDLRIQSIHNAGLIVFMLSAVVSLCLLGWHWITSRSGPSRYAGVIPWVAAWGAWTAPGWAIFPAELLGLSQRVSLFLLWLGFAAVGFFFPASERAALSSETERALLATANSRVRG